MTQDEKSEVWNSDRGTDDSSDPPTNDGSSATTAWIQAGVALLILVLGVFAMSYPGHLQELGNKQACHEEYGPTAEYLGTEGFGSNVALCKTPDGTKQVAGQTAPMNWDTFTDYTQAVLAGEA